VAPATDRLIVITGGGSGIGVPNRLLGFARKAKNEKRYGLPEVRERGKQIGAEVMVCSRIGTGTEIELSIPGSIAYRTCRAAVFRRSAKRYDEFAFGTLT
jgi:hypothetical protein